MLNVITAASKSPSDQTYLLYNEGTCCREKSAIPLLNQALFITRSPSEAALLNLFSACVWSSQFLQESRKPEHQSHPGLQPIQKWDWYCIRTATPSSSTLYNSQTLSTLPFHPSDSIWQARFGIPWYFENAQLTSRAGYSQYSSGLLFAF